MSKKNVSKKSAAKTKLKLSKHDPIEGAAMLRRVFPMLSVLADSGTQRDKAGNRQLLFSQYAGLVLVGLLNPILNSARSLVAASGLKKVRQLTGGKKFHWGHSPKRRRSSIRRYWKALSKNSEHKFITSNTSKRCSRDRGCEMFQTSFSNG